MKKIILLLFVMATSQLHSHPLDSHDKEALRLFVMDAFDSIAEETHVEEFRSLKIEDSAFRTSEMSGSVKPVLFYASYGDVTLIFDTDKNLKQMLLQKVEKLSDESRRCYLKLVVDVSNLQGSWHTSVGDSPAQVKSSWVASESANQYRVVSWRIEQFWRSSDNDYKESSKVEIVDSSDQ